ncbi:MAG: hypothetical protein KKI06_05705 [Euryarchaeota archaeon]|nr:hypothetical protein [Euryarchaeota archaeon]MBU4221617.1 hypothetical protein [Euryarchaeota archaeon]
MVLLETLTIASGAIYGYLKPGKEDRTALLKKGVLIGIILGLVFTGLGMLVNIKFLLPSSVVGFLIFIEVIILAVLFVLGTFIGDWLEEKSKAA